MPRYFKEDELIETRDYPTSKFVSFGQVASEFFIRNTNGFQAAASTTKKWYTFNIEVNANGINQLTKALDGKEIKLSDMEIWEL